MSALPDYSDALDAALQVVQPLPGNESVWLREAAGRILDADVVADRDLPPFDRAQMDGYALRAAEFGSSTTWPVIARIAAGQSVENVRLAPGTCAAIATGAPLPADADTVIQHEKSNRNDPVTFTISAIETGHAVHPRGADAKQHDILIRAGTRLQPHQLGIAASVGCAKLPVRRRPQAIVLTSGDEVVAIDQPVQSHKIRNSNGIMVSALLHAIGAEPIAHRHVNDEFEPTRKAVGDALNESELVITIGGISAGERDHFPDAFATHHVECALRGAAIQPGKPVIVGRASNGTIVIGLPGNTVSALACTCLFVWPIVRRMLGLDDGLPWRTVALGDSVKPNPHRRAFRPAILTDDGEAIVPKWAGSGDLVHTAPTHGLLELPVQSGSVAAGTTLRFLPWPGGS